MRFSRKLFARALLTLAACVASSSLHARPVVALTASNQLLHFDSNTPATIALTVPITGLLGSDSIHAIDFRPSTGVLYGLGITTDDGSDEARLYVIDPNTGQATAVGNQPFTLSFTGGGFYGFDFNPVADVIRVVSSSDQSARVSPVNGTLVASDTPLNGAGAGEVVALAYDRNDKNPGTATTLFGIEFTNSRLVRIGGADGNPSPNGGVVTTVGALAGVTAANRDIGFDVDDTGLAWASIATGAPATYRLYLINLSNAQPSAIGTIGNGMTAIRDIALAPKPIMNTNTYEVFDSMSAAVADADTLNGHTIVVSAGTYDDFVTANKRVTFRGAQAGVDPRGANRTAETVVRGSLLNGKRTTVFHLTTSGVMIDGFTIEGSSINNNLGAAIVLAPGTSGANIRNNIIKNNLAGIYLANLDLKSPALIERNRFDSNNNLDTGGGFGIVSDQNIAGGPLRNAVINENVFTDHNTGAIYLVSDQADALSRLVISNNTMTGNGIGIHLSRTTSSKITRNTISGANASPSAAGVHIRLATGVNALTIEENRIQQAPNSGIIVANFGGSPSTDIAINCNFFADNAQSALTLTPGSYTGPLDATGNWWGAQSGPKIASNPSGSGDAIVDSAGQVDYSGFLNTSSDESQVPGFQCDPSATLYAVDSTNKLLQFRTINLSPVSTAITGLQAGETIRGIDFRPTTGELFAITSANRLYVINPLTAVATERAQLSTALGGTGLGMAFDPVLDLTSDASLRVITNIDQNVRINVVTGAVASDTPISPGPVNIDAIAYTNSDLDPQTGTALIGYDFTNDQLVKTADANAGAFTASGPSGYTASIEVNMAMQTAGGRNVLYVALQRSSGETHLYIMDTFNGLLTPVGEIGNNLNLGGGLAVVPAGVLQLSSDSFSVNEAAGTATITVTRTGGNAGYASFNVGTTPGTATPPADYAGNLVVAATFNPGETSRTVNVPIVNDAVDEPNETFSALLRFPGDGATIGSPSTAVVTIVDDDLATPTLASSAPATPVGRPLVATATVANGGNPTGTVTFNFYAPDDGGCAAPIFTSIVQVNGNGTYSSEPFTPTRTGTYRVVATYSGDGNNVAASGSCDDPSAAFSVNPATVLANIATRLRVENGDNVLIGGIIVTGTQPKRMLVRAIGPSSGVEGSLGDPYLELYAGSDLVTENNNWRDAGNQQEIIDSTLAPGDERESAVLVTLNPGQYTAVVSGVNGETGVSLVEAYDLDRTVDSRFGNIATRGRVQTGSNVMIGGLIVLGDTAQKVLVRAIGPSLPIDGKLADPTLELVDGNGDTLATNNNWRDDQQAEIEATGIPPDNDLESAIFATLSPAPYTAIVRGVDDGTGIALVEVYALD